MSVTSSKIPRQIKAILFKDDKYTTLFYKEKYKPAGSEEIIHEEMPKKSDMPRHGAFDRAMERFAVHAVIRSGFYAALDRHGKVIDADWWNDHLYEDDERFNTIKVHGVIITTKETQDNFQIIYTKEAEDGSISNKIKSPPISIIKVEGWNYPLIDEAKLHLETLLMEAEEYRKGKSSLGQLKMALVA